MSDSRLLGVETIAHREYVETRRTPRPGDKLYLHLSDLELAFRKYSSRSRIKVLDFGCGGSPYRNLFPHADYRRADIAGIPDVDYVIGQDGTIIADDGTFDMILSTQVLEHVSDAGAYLRECQRLLQPGQKLVLSTHGIFEDHGCPQDYWRWTAGGLRKLIVQNGFEVDHLSKITTSGRAVAFILEHHRRMLGVGRRSLIGGCLWLFSNMILRNRRSFHRWCDRALDGCREVSDLTPGHGLYIGLVVAATRK